MRAIVRTAYKYVEGGLTRLPAKMSKKLEILVTKVTVSRQTEDQLMRDMLASTASFINCVGGTNGKNMVVAVLKSWVIDLELLDEDNKAQAQAA